MVVRKTERVLETNRHGTGKEVILRGGVLPGVTQVAVATLDEGFEAELHSHPTMYEIYFVLSGKAEYRLNGVEHAVEPGDFLVVPPGTVHRQRVTEGPHSIFYWGMATGPEPVLA